MIPTAERRRRIRFVARLRDRLPSQGDDGVPALPHRLWRDLGRNLHLQQRSATHGWSAALRELRDEQHLLCDQLIAVLQYARPRPTSDRPVTPLREMLADLEALEDEFPAVHCDLEHGTLSVVTDPIMLDDVDLGSFEIVLHLHDLQRAVPYAVLAKAGNRESHRENVIHPHVQDGVLCEGEGRHAIRSALREGRLADFFLLVRQVLETYNADSAYVRVADWSGRDCTDCGTSVTDDESATCRDCGSDLCWDCARRCGRCEEDTCSECRVTCDACGATSCQTCATTCERCSGDLCDECADEGLCPTCRAKQEPAKSDTTTESDSCENAPIDSDPEPQETDSDDDDPRDSTTTIAATDRTDPAVHAAGVGAAALPA